MKIQTISTYKQKLPQKQILAIGGSPRKNGNSDILLETILQSTQKYQIHHDIAHLREYEFASCIGCERCRKKQHCTTKDEMQELYPKIINSQAMIWVCPAHNYNVTALMKAFIDRLYTFYNFDNNKPRGWNSQLSGQNRKAIIGAIAEQVNEKDMGFTLEGMRLVLQALGYEIVGEIAVFGIFERGGIQNDHEALEEAKKLGISLAKSLQ